jgi:hypothetical protein
MFVSRPNGDNERVRLTMLAALAALAASQGATAAVTVGSNATAPALRVDAGGNVEVSWTSAGQRHTALVRAGSAAPALGGALPGADVSELVRGDHIPFQRVLRSGPGGWYYALQAWRRSPGGSVLLRFSRWRGVPTEVSLTATKSGAGVRLSGRATLDEQGLPLTTPRSLVYLDALVHGTWRRVSSAELPRSASYRRTIAKEHLGDRYRAIVPGPNLGATLAPDASAIVDAPGDLDPPRRPK